MGDACPRARQLRRPIRVRRSPARRTQLSPRRARAVRVDIRSIVIDTPHRTVAASPRHKVEVGVLILAVIGALTWSVGVSESPLAPLSSEPTAEIEPAPVTTIIGGSRIEPERALPAPFDFLGEIRSRIEHAAGVVGVDAGYLLAVAARESRFDPTIHAQGTTASGLYQFTEDTWLRAVKSFGARHGLAEEARKITSNARGELSMPDAKARARLMNLRADPKLAALMAAELARDNKVRLERILGRRVSRSETYIAHLLGVGAAARMINAVHTAPSMPAAWLLPTAARTNPGLFMSAGRTLSVRAMVAKVKADFEREVPRFTVT